VVESSLRSGGGFVRRRDIITLIGGAAAGWPVVASAQQVEGVRNIGVLFPATSHDLEFQAWLGVFEKTLQQSGWTDGGNVHIETRWASSDVAEIRRQAAELVAKAPDVILAYGTSTVGPLLQFTRTIPIVFPIAGDPVGAGYVDSLARPGGNVTGFMTYEYSIGGKWLELLKQIAPDVIRAAVLRDTTTPTGIGQFGVIQAVGSSLKMEVIPLNLREASEIERDLAAFAHTPKGGVVVPGSASASRYHDLILTLVASHKLPAVYAQRSFVAAGGLASYGADVVHHFRLAAGYVDRILRGEKPSNLPVQAPNKYELVINLRAAGALGLTVPPTLLAGADEVIE